MQPRQLPMIKLYLFRTKSFTLFFLLFILVTASYSQNAGASGFPDKAQYENGKLFLRFKAGLSFDVSYNRYSGFSNTAAQIQFRNIFLKYGVTKSEITFKNLPYKNLNNIWTITIADDKFSDSLMLILKQHPSVEYCEKVPLYKVFYTPDDSLYYMQYYLPFLQADSAWSYSTGDTAVKIAVIDDAIQISHEDLANKIWHNYLETPNDSIDNDANGYIDDYTGYDVADNDPDPSPSSTSFFTHGTMVAGAAGAETDNLIGISSISFNCSIIPIKSKADSTTGGYLTTPYLGIEYAIAAGANVINMSWGGLAYSQTYDSLCVAARSSGIVLVAASGNSGSDVLVYPASYNGVISVGATDINDVVAPFSTYNDSVDVMAPGMSVLTTTADSASGDYGTASGTSLSAPLVSAICALMKANSPAMTPVDIENCLKNGSRNIYKKNPFYVGKIGAGRVDVLNALLCIETPPPLITPACHGGNCLIGFFVCKNSYAHYDASQYVANVQSCHWYFPGGNPQQSTNTAINVQYNYPGIFDMILVYCNTSGICDSLVFHDYVYVGDFHVTLTSNSSGIVCKNEPAYLDVIFHNGVPPYAIAYTDGVIIDTITGIYDDHFSILVTPQYFTTYSVFWAADSLCESHPAATLSLSPITCNPCTNIDFEFGNFTTWSGQWGYCCGSTDFHYGIQQSRQQIISVQDYDPHSFNTVYMIDSSDGGHHSVRLGNWFVNKESETLYKKIKVLPENALITFRYAVFLQDPFGHLPPVKPKFSAMILDSNGVMLPEECSHYTVTAGTATEGWQANNLIRYHDWQATTMDLSSYLNQNVFLHFKTEDCGHGGHFGYAYIDAECSPAQVSVENFCDTTGYIVLTAPDGYITYQWHPSGDTTQSIIINNPQTGDTISVSMVNAIGCPTTITHIINVIDVPEPGISLADTTICFQDTVLIAGFANGQNNNFSWFSDPPGFTSTEDTIFVSPAETTTYFLTVSNEYHCMADTVLQATVHLNHQLLSDITDTYYICDGDSITLSGDTIPGIKLDYAWSSYPPLFSAAGMSITVFPDISMIYILTTSDSLCNFRDSVFVSQYPYSFNSPTSHAYICENDSVATLTAPSDGAGYFWPKTGDTTQSITVINPELYEIFCVHFTSLYGCTDSAFFIIDYLPNPIAYGGNDTSVCEDMPVMLYASGSESPDAVYSWTSVPPGLNVTADSVLVFPDTTTLYILQASNGSLCPGMFDFDTVKIDVIPDPTFDLGQDISICLGQAVSLLQNDNAGVHFWSSSPEGYFCQDSVAIVSPGVSTTYYLTLYAGYCSFVDSIRIIIPEISQTLNDTADIYFCPNPDYLYLVSAPDGFSSYYWPVYNETGQSVVISNIEYGDLLAVVVQSPDSLCPDTLLIKAHNAFSEDSIYALADPEEICSGDIVTLTLYNDSLINEIKWYVLNGNDSTLLGTGNNFSWMPAEGDTNIIVIASNYYCTYIDSVSIKVSVIPGFDFGNDTTICYGDTIFLCPHITEFSSMLWSTGSTDSVIAISKSGSYLLEVTNGLCISSDSIHVEVLPPLDGFFIPNVFTPNGDGMNDELAIPVQWPEEFHLQIYNRWGEILFETEDAFDTWKGKTAGGADIDEGTYFYIVNYKSECSDKNIILQGTVTLMR
jgi:gliding motility-associated-like protein